MVMGEGCVTTGIGCDKTGDGAATDDKECVGRPGVP